MAENTCSNCGAQLNETSDKCTNCEERSKTAIAWPLKFAIVFFIAIVVYLASQNKSNVGTTKPAEATPSNGIATELSAQGVQKILPTEGEIKQILKPFSVRKDDMEGITWITCKGENNSFRSRVAPYMGRRDDNFWLRFKVVYHGDRWLFLESFSFKADQVKVDYPLNKTKVERDNSSSVWEWIDVRAGEDEVYLLRTISSAKKTEMRFYGSKYHRDRTLTKNENECIKKMLSAWDKLRKD